MEYTLQLIKSFDDYFSFLLSTGAVVDEMKAEPKDQSTKAQALVD